MLVMASGSSLKFAMIKYDSVFSIGFHTLLKGFFLILESTDFPFYIDISNINVLYFKTTHVC